MNMEQASLSRPEKNDEEIAALPTPEVVDVDVETLTHEEIKILLPGLSHIELTTGYKKFVGKDPMARGLSDEELRQGIADPAAELERLGIHDAAEDRDEKSRHWSN